jgi:hypothetical protein
VNDIAATDQYQTWKELAEVRPVELTRLVCRVNPRALNGLAGVWPTRASTRIRCTGLGASAACCGARWPPSLLGSGAALAEYAHELRSKEVAYPPYRARSLTPEAQRQFGEA